MTKKYELSHRDCEYEGKTLYRIKALRDFATPDGLMVTAGELGGFVESEDNLSQDDACWITDNAKVFGNAFVACNARLSEEAEVFGDAKIAGNAFIRHSYGL